MRRQRAAIMPPGLLDKRRPYADWRWTSGYGYRQYVFPRVLCALRLHKWKWTFCTIIDGQQQWHLQCVRCRRQERNPRETHHPTT